MRGLKEERNASRVVLYTVSMLEFIEKKIILKNVTSIIIIIYIKIIWLSSLREGTKEIYNEYEDLITRDVSTQSRCFLWSLILIQSFPRRRSLQHETVFILERNSIKFVEELHYLQ